MTETATAPLPRTGAHRSTRDGRFSVARLHRTGPRPCRILVIGSASVFDSPDAADGSRLVDRIADGVQVGTHCGVDLDLLCEPGPVLDAIHRTPDFWRMWRYDLLVVALPVRRGLRSARRAEHLRDLVDEVLPRIAGRGAALVIDPASGTADAPRSDPDDPSTVRIALDLRDTAAPHRLVAEIVRLVDGCAKRGRSDDQDEERRQRALDDLGLLHGRSDLQLERIVRTAKQGFGVAVAALNLISRDELVTVAVDGIEPLRMPRRATLCNRAISRSDTLIVPDTWTEPDLRGHPAIGGPRAVRFYAAHPIESVDGYRIGTLCIMDFEPHPADTFDLTMLRDLALLAEAELVAAAQ